MLGFLFGLEKLILGKKINTTMRVLSKVMQILLAVTFIFSAYTKAVGPGFFEITLMDQGLAPSRVLAGHMARFFIGLEFALGFLMLLPFTLSN